MFPWGNGSRTKFTVELLKLFFLHKELSNMTAIESI